MVVVEDAKGKAEGGFEPNNAVRGALELDLFLVGGVGSVVRSDAVYSSVDECFDDGEAVRFGSEGRVHFALCVERGAG